MPTLTLRNLDPKAHNRLCERAAQYGRSVEAEVCVILDDATRRQADNILVALHDQVSRVGAGTDLEILPRTDRPRDVTLPRSWPTRTSSSSS